MTPMNDLKGMKYGLLTVLHKVSRPSWAKNKSIYWFCRCDCGKELIISASRLRSKGKRSCGCARYNDLSGKIFGILTVLMEYGKDKNGKRLWICKCECGNEKEVKGSSLKSGNTKSCGCLSKNMFLSSAEDLVERRFERLVVLEIVKANKTGSHWLCQCDCGNKKVIAAKNLKQGYTKSCGCLKKERVSAAHRLEVSEAAFNAVFYEYKSSAKARGFEFLLSKNKFRILTEQNCYYCGCSPSNVRKAQNNNGNYIYSGIDRVDNFKGYTIKNTVPCCKDCNWAKKDKSLGEFKNWVKLIYKNFIKNKEQE